MPERALVSIDGAMVDEAAVQGFKPRLRGELVRPGDESYDSVRRIWNGMFDKKPGLIVRCAGVSDVIATVNFAREHHILLAVRGGGHSFPGKSVCDGGIMLDLSLLRGIRVDPGRRMARAEPDARWGDLDRETQAFGLATTGGQVSDTGIAGLTLGGGMGWLMRQCGLTCDNLVSADVVTADGKLLTASPTQNTDLFWGLKGGGGNFGVVTSFEYQLHPVGPVLGGLVAYPLPEGKKVLRSFHDYVSDTPDELTTTAALLTSPDGHPAVGIVLCYNGDLTKGEKLIQPLKKLGTVVMERLGPMPYPAVQSMMDETVRPGRRVYMKGDLLNDLNGNAVDTLVDHFVEMPSPYTIGVLVQMGGAVSRVGKDQTAFFHRNAAYNMSVFSIWTSPKDDRKNIQWTRDLWGAMRPYSSGGVYVNEMGAEDEDRVRNAYSPKTYDRLVALKNRYDPTNFFQLNQNIKPTV